MAIRSRASRNITPNAPKAEGSGFHEEGGSNDRKFRLFHEASRYSPQTPTEERRQADNELDARLGIVADELFQILPADCPVLRSLNHDHGTHRAHRIKKIHFANPFSALNRTKQNLAIRIPPNRMEHTTDDKEQPAMRVPLRNQTLSGIRQMKISIGTQGSSILLREPRH
jgi:hypothetical protein